jgi:hypothetical protein
MHVRLPRRSRLRRMFWHDRLRRLFWDDKWGKTVTGIWGAAWSEWIAIAFLWLLVWRHEHSTLHPGSHRPGVALAAALIPLLGVVANSTTRRQPPYGDDHEAALGALLAVPGTYIVRSAPSEARRCPRI